MVRSVTTRTPEWTDTDRSMVRAFLDYERLVCRGCGGYLPETTDPEHEGGYEASPPHRCHQCTAIERQRESYEDAPHPSALVVWPAERKRRRHG